VDDRARRPTCSGPFISGPGRRPTGSSRSRPPGCRSGALSRHDDAPPQPPPARRSGCTALWAAAQPADQDPRHDGRSGAIEGNRLRGRPGERDATVLRRSNISRRGGLHPGHRAPGRRRARSLTSPRVASVFAAVGTDRLPATAGRISLSSLASRRHTRPTPPIARSLESDRWQRLLNVVARPQRSSGRAPARRIRTRPTSMYVEALAAPLTVNTMRGGQRCSRMPTRHGLRDTRGRLHRQNEALLARFEAGGS